MRQPGRTWSFLWATIFISAGPWLACSGRSKATRSDGSGGLPAGSAGSPASSAGVAGGSQSMGGTAGTLAARGGAAGLAGSPGGTSSGAGVPGGSSSGTGMAGGFRCRELGCPAGERCLSFLWTCGTSTSSCSADPSANCQPTISPACGCDGGVYDDDCAVYAAGMELDGYSPACAPPPDMFACGYTFCRTGEEFCLERYEAGWSCEPLPTTCRGNDPTCDCDDASGAGGDGGEAGGTTVDWSLVAGDSRCRECVDQGATLKVNCSPF